MPSVSLRCRLSERPMLSPSMLPPARSSRLPPASGYQAWYRLLLPPSTSDSNTPPWSPSTLLPIGLVRLGVITERGRLYGSLPAAGSVAEGVPAVYTPYSEVVAISPADTRRRSPVPVRTTLGNCSRPGRVLYSVSGGTAGEPTAARPS
ncbi:hypothetical protein D3C72_1297420 [compost metagenome]